MKSTVGLLRVALLGAVLAACGAEAEGGAGAVTVRDSSGIEIVESRGDGWEDDEGWRLSAQPLLEIGVAEGSPEYLFDRVTGARRLADGRIVVADAGTAELHFYGEDGRHQRSVGGRGDGPGEFQNISWLGLFPGDSLIAHDLFGRRSSIFSSAGEFGRTLTFHPVDGGSPPNILAAFSDGTLLGGLTTAVRGDQLSSGMRRSEARFARFAGSDGTLLDSIAVLPGRESHLLVDGGSIMVTTPLLAPESFVAAAGDRVLLGYSGSSEMQLRAADGTLLRLIRRLREPVPVTAADLERLTEERLGNMPDEGIRARMSDIMGQMPAPQVRPAFADLRADDAGNLWVRESVILDEPKIWTVFDDDGRLLGPIELPDGFRPLHIGHDFVLGVASDELDVQRIRVYRLEKDG
jgi:hypothetical protein